MWYVQHQTLLKTDPEGPFEDKQLVELAKLGDIKADTLLYHKKITKAEWVPASRFPKLSQVFEQRRITMEKQKQERRREKQELALRNKQARQELAMEKKTTKQRMALEKMERKQELELERMGADQAHAQKIRKLESERQTSPRQLIPAKPAKRIREYPANEKIVDTPVIRQSKESQIPRQIPQVVPVASQIPQPTNVTGQQQQQTVVVNFARPREYPKSMLTAFLLTFFFGPFGMFYSTVTGGLVCLFTGLFVLPIIVLFTLGLGFVLYIPYWLVCLWWAMAACHSRALQ